MNSLKRQVLSHFKSIHRTRQKIFSGDENALAMARAKINEEYAKNRNITDKKAIEELIKTSKDAEEFALATIIQAEEVRPGVFRAKIREEITKFENVPYKDNPNLDREFGLKRKGKSKCQEIGTEPEPN